MTHTATKIFVSGLEVQASIGVYPHERESTQAIIIDIEVDMGAVPTPKNDLLAETFDYSLIADKAQKIAHETHVQLVETLASRIAKWAIAEDKRVQSCTVRIAKPHALLKTDTAGCQITLYRHG
ncbi:MAG: dihydroneopterin aldolase [Robiginitomaculum sp.]